MKTIDEVASGVVKNMTRPLKREERVTVAQQIIATRLQNSDQLKFDKDYEKPWQENTRLEKAFEYSLKNGCFRPGVGVILTPSGAGKTTRMKKVCKKLLDSKEIGGVIFVSFEEDDHGTIYERISKHLSVDPELKLNMNDLVPEGMQKKPVIVFDQVENAFSCDGFKRYFTGITSGSNNGNNTHFFVMAMCSDDKIAEEMLLYNHGDKFYAVLSGNMMLSSKPSENVLDWVSGGVKWHSEECADFIVKRIFERFGNGGVNIDLTTLFEIAATAGTPGFCRHVVEEVLPYIVANTAIPDDKISSLRFKAQKKRT